MRVQQVKDQSHKKMTAPHSYFSDHHHHYPHHHSNPPPHHHPHLPHPQQPPPPPSWRDVPIEASSSSSMETSNHSSNFSVPRITIQDNSDSDNNAVESVDKYTAGIELSNACRRYYVARLQGAERIKERLGLKCHTPCWGSKDSLDLRTAGSTGFLDTIPATKCPPPSGSYIPSASSSNICPSSSSASSSSSAASASHRNSTSSPLPRRPRNSIDKAMMLLKHEVASLMDQDLALMKQLLTLNEQIEELKWQRKLRAYSKGSLTNSSSYLDSESSANTLSDFDYDSTNERELPPKYPSPSSLSLYSQETYSTTSRTSSQKTLDAGFSDDAQRESSSDLGSYDELHGRSSVTELRRRATSSGESSPEDTLSYRKCHGEQQSFDSGIHENSDSPQNTLKAEVLL